MDVIGLGTVVVDHLVVLPAAPSADAKTTVIEDRFQVGGPVPTALVLLRRLGRKCAFIGTWADDAYGRMIEEDFAHERLDYLRSDVPGVTRTGFAHVWVDSATGARTVACYRPPEGIELSPEHEEALRGARLLHLDGWPGAAAVQAARIVRENGGTVVLDTGSPKPDMEQLIRLADVVNCPRRFISQFLETDDIAAGTAALLEMGPRMVTVTDGAARAFLATAEGTIAREAYDVRAADTTGTGDVFCGALINGLLSRWRPERMLPFAMAAGAVKCRKLGNREALPSEKEILALEDQQTVEADEDAAHSRRLT